MRKLISRTVLPLLSALLLLLLPASAAKKRPANIAFTTAVVQIDSRRCVTMFAALVDDVFDRLERVETKKGVEFREGSRLVTHFPEEVTILLFAIEDFCGAKRDGPRILPGVGPWFVNGLHFDAHWKRGAMTIPIHHMSVTPTVEPRPIWDENVSLSHGYYTLTIYPDEVPVTDSLVICASSAALPQPICIEASLDWPAPRL